MSFERVECLPICNPSVGAVQAEAAWLDLRDGVGKTISILQKVHQTV